MTRLVLNITPEDVALLREAMGIELKARTSVVSTMSSEMRGAAVFLPFPIGAQTLEAFAYGVLMERIRNEIHTSRSRRLLAQKQAMAGEGKES